MDCRCRKLSLLFPSAQRRLAKTRQLREGGVGELPIKWGCAAGWGRIFTTGFTTMGLHFQQSSPIELLEWGRKLSGVWG